MDEIIILGIASSAKSLAEENATAIDALKGGMKYKGAVANYASLPTTGNKAGDVYSTLDDGNEYVWGSVGGTNQWIQLGSASAEPLTNAEIDEIVSGLPTPKASLEEYTWEEIQKFSNALVEGTLSLSDLASVYNITDSVTNTKAAVIGGETLYYHLIGTLHDDDENDKKAGMSFEPVGLMSSLYKMKNSMGTSDSWSNSNLKTTLEGLSVESSLAAVITPVKKVCAHDVSSGTPTYEYINTTNGLWIASETEVFGTQTFTAGGVVEGSRYAFYANGGSRVKSRNGSAYTWWLRSPYNRASVFATVTNSGSALDFYANQELGLAPCFCI